MRQFTIIGTGDDFDRLRCDGYRLCTLSPNVFKWPSLQRDEEIQVTQLVIQKGGRLSREKDSNWYIIKTKKGMSDHCAEDFEHYTSKRYHLQPGESMSVTVIKLLLKPR